MYIHILIGYVYTQPFRRLGKNWVSKRFFFKEINTFFSAWTL